MQQIYAFILNHYLAAVIISISLTLLFATFISKRYSFDKLTLMDVLFRVAVSVMPMAIMLLLHVLATTTFYQERVVTVDAKTQQNGVTIITTNGEELPVVHERPIQVGSLIHIGLRANNTWFLIPDSQFITE